MAKNSNLTEFEAIDLFSGAGGFSLAAINCGVNVIAAIEFDVDASETYKKNIVEKRSPKTEFFPIDILEINPQELRNKLKLEKKHLDMIIGGPPCQGFSTHRINDQGIDDPRNELLIRYFDFVKEFEPKIFLVENVPGLLWKRHEKYLSEFCALAELNNYVLRPPVVLDAKDFGVPQNRKRVFLLGIRKDISLKNLSWPPKPTHFSPKLGKNNWKTASTVFSSPPKKVLDKLSKEIGKDVVKELIFGDPIQKLSLDPSAIHMKHTPNLVKRFADTPINGSRTDSGFRLPCHEGDYAGHKDVYGRIRLAQPSPTITTGCFNPSKGRFLHPWLNHGITVRHAARLQTFPDDFVFSSGITSQGKQVGNAVPIKLGQELISALKNFLQSTEM